MKTLTVEATTDNLSQVLDFVNEVMEEAGFPVHLVMRIDIAVEELFVNIANYSYGRGRGNAEIRVWIEEDPKTIAISFIDSGIPYDPLKKADPDITLPLEERQIGGLGIFMVKKTMDDVSYEWKDGCNVLTIRKRLLPA